MNERKRKQILSAKTGRQPGPESFVAGGRFEKGAGNSKRKERRDDPYTFGPLSACFFVSAFKQFCEKAHANSRAKGFWKKRKSFSEDIALMHSELSEALEASRHGDPPDDKIPKFTGREAELADCIIRIADRARKDGLRVAEAIIAKMEFNASRPHMHGKKF